MLSKHDMNFLFALTLILAQPVGDGAVAGFLAALARLFGIGMAVGMLYKADK